jgi:hypothetical protein
MHLGESLLATGAVVTFTMGALQLNTMRLDSQVRMLESELRTTALSLAQSYVERAQGLSFDEAVVAAAPAASLQEHLTEAVGLGPDAGESVPFQFDDVDDFHAYSEQVVTPRADYRVAFTTTYADSATLSPSSQRGLLKWLTVEVSSPHYRDTLRVHYLCAFR